MRPEFRNISIGMAIGGSLAASIIIAGLAFRPIQLGPAPSRQTEGQSAMVASTAPGPGASPGAPSPTFTAIPTLAGRQNVAPGLDLESSPTPDFVAAAISQGGLVFTGPLSHPQQAELYRVSLRYAQPTVKDSKRESKEINGVGYGDPTNICGPLAIAILRDANLIASDVLPHDFWLLDPRAPTDKAKLRSVFASDKFDHTIVTTAINKVDWLATPLEPGDFLFIWHGSGGNFDHMLVVNRVDQDMRAYAVTNFGTLEGYVISETMLYDPHDPNAGIFHTWTKERDAILGSTGFGGYELWRLRGR